MASTGLDLLQSGEALLALAEATLHRLKPDMAGACAAKVKSHTGHGRSLVGACPEKSRMLFGVGTNHIIDGYSQHPCQDLVTHQDTLAERSKAVAQGAIPKGRGLEPHRCHLCTLAAACIH